MRVRSSPEEMASAAASALQDALSYIGIGHDWSDADGTLRVRVPGTQPVGLQIKAASLPSPDWVRDLDTSNGWTVVVADQITGGVREALNERGIGWLDRRGHLHLTTQGIFVDADIAPLPRLAMARPNRSAINGRSGFACAAALLMHPNDPIGVSEIARRASLNASSISRAMTTLAEAQFAEPTGRGRYKPLAPELFWALAEVWPTDRVNTGLTIEDLNDPRLGAKLGDLGERGWALGGERGAVALGAPLLLTGDFPTLLYVPNEESIRLTNALARPVGGADAGAFTPSTIQLRVDPCGLATIERLAGIAGSPPLAHPLFCALDLTASSRDREALDQWDPPKEFTRVW